MANKLLLNKEESPFVNTSEEDTFICRSMSTFSNCFESIDFGSKLGSGSSFENLGLVPPIGEVLGQFFKGWGLKVFSE